MVFTGTFEHTIDSKNRLAVPAEVRAQVQRATGLGEGDPIRLVVTIGEGNSLRVYTEAGFEQRARRLRHMDVDKRKRSEFRRLMFARSQLMELDKQGRLLLPAALLKSSGLSGPVVLLGVEDHLEIRDREQWQRDVERSMDEFEEMFWD